MGYFDDPYSPQDPIGSALGKWSAEKIGDIAPLITPERVAQFAQNPFDVGQDPVVLEAVTRNTPARGLHQASVGKFQQHMGNPTKVNIPMPGDAPPDSEMYRALRGREALASHMPVSNEPLLGYGQPPVNPLAGIDPRMLTKLVNVGGSSSSSRTQQTTKGTRSMPGYDLGLDVAAGRAEGAQERIGEAQAEAATQKALELGRHETALKARQTAFDAREKDTQAQIAAQESKASAMRAEVATMKEDPDRWWSSRSAGQRVSLGIAAALSGFVQGFRGQAGPNAVVAMTQKLIDRDINLQTRAIARKGKQAAEERGVVADLYRRLGDIRQAETQGRIMLTEGLKTKLDQIAMTAAAPVARANAEMASAQLDQQILGLKNQAFQQAQDKVTVSKRSTSSSRRAPLGSVLAKMAAAQAKAQGKAKEAGKVGGPPTEKVRQRLGVMNGLRRDLVHFYKSYKGLGLPAGATGFWGGKGAAVQEMGNRILDRYVAAVVPGGGSAEHLKLFKGLLGGKYATDKDLKLRLSNIMSEVDNVETSTMEAEADAGINVLPYYKRAKHYRSLTQHLRGKH